MSLDVNAGPNGTYWLYKWQVEAINIKPKTYNNMEINRRSISEKFLEDLKVGELHPITDLVRVDPYLDMEMRGNCVMVYYRGGRILTIYEDKTIEGLVEEYYPLYVKIERVHPLIDNIENYLSHAKHIVDLHESSKYSKLGEKEIQQCIVYENNMSVNAENSDYFIADIEWADNGKLGGRADIVAFRWNHMEHRKREIQLTLIEVKQGENAITTSETKDGLTAGLSKHYDDFIRFAKDSEYVKSIAADMLLILKQKKELGLVKGIDMLFEDGNHLPKVPTIKSEPDFIFLLANYHHYSTKLKEECKKLPDDCKFIYASFCGYGLYKDFITTSKCILQSTEA